MTIHSVQSSFSPKPPAFPENFFGPEMTVIEEPQSQIQSPSSLNPSSFGVPNFLNPHLSPHELQRYQNFLDQCVSVRYETTDYGTVCKNHPEAQHPYPGPAPQNPHPAKAVLNQLIQRGFSKKFREAERDYKNALRHWEAQMKEHLLEVPYLRAQDSLFKGYVALLKNHPEEALSLAQEALNYHAFSLEALSIQIIAQYQQKNYQKAALLERELLKLEPQAPLNIFGQTLLENIVQETLIETYTNACQRALSQIKDSIDPIPLQKGYLLNKMKSLLSQVCQERFGVEGIDWLDLVALYFLEETISENPGELNPKACTDVELNFPHLTGLFEALEENLGLIAQKELWEYFPASALLKESPDPKSHMNKDWIKAVIQELTQPIEIGDLAFRRAFMLNAIKIKMEKSLFEIAPHLKDSFISNSA